MIPVARSPFGTTWAEQTARGVYSWTDRNRDVWFRPANPQPGDPPVKVGRAATIDRAKHLISNHQLQGATP